MKKIPLEKRLRQTKTLRNMIPAAAWLYTKVFWEGLSEMSGNQYYYDIFLFEDQKDCYGDLYEVFVAQLASMALNGGQPPEVGMETLYRLLVEPFTNKKIFKEKGRSRK